MSQPAIASEGLGRDYGSTRALDALDLTVQSGTMVGLLGPNGAGKTTTMLLLAIFTALVWCLTLWETEVREPRWPPAAFLVLSVMAGLLTGVGGLTRYAFAWMILPVLVFFILFGGIYWAVPAWLAPRAQVGTVGGAMNTGAIQRSEAAGGYVPSDLNQGLGG